MLESETSGLPPKPSREESLARAAVNLKAKRRETRRKSCLVLTVSVLAILVPVALLAGADLSAWFYPPEVEATEPTARPGEVVVVRQGSQVTVRLIGTLDNGTTFADNLTVDGTIGDGTFVPGLERALLGLAPGENFSAVVAPRDGYGNWSTSRTYHQQPTESVNRNTTMEVGNFHDRWGTPHLGQVVGATPWPSTVASIGTMSVHLQYTPVVGEVVSYHKYWDSRVVWFNNSRIQIENLIWTGYTYSRVSSATGNTLTYVVTKVDSRGYLFDRNSPLAGQTLHYTGALLAAEGGTGLSAMASPLLVTGLAVSLGSQRCERCHGAFVPFDASASAAFEGTGVAVNLTVQNPWRHDLTKVSVVLEALEGNQTVASATEGAPDLSRGRAEEVSVLLPDGPATEGMVRVVVNGNAHYVHRSAGRHDDNAYQMAFEIPIGGPGRVSAAAAGQVVAEPVKTPAEFWGLVGQWAGAAALVAACLPAMQGLKRHAGLKPRFKVPKWLTAHFTMSVAVVTASLAHAVTLMSATYHDAWTWDVWAGVAGLFALAALGISGVVLAKWTPARWPRTKRIHYVLLTGFIFAGALHIFASSTTLRWLIGR